MIPTISKECGQFLEESKMIPLIKMLPSKGETFRRVKVRKKDWDSTFISSFNKAFNTYKNLMQRSVISQNVLENIDGKEMFYIFPIDGYKFLYSPLVDNSKNHYESLFNKLSDCLKENSADMFVDIIRNQYVSENLGMALKNNYELIIYDIPYYYALRKSIVDDYKGLIYDIQI
jgi:hypothetical protein